MQKYSTSTLLFIGGCLLLPLASARAQATFGMGARVGLNVSTAPFKDELRTYATGSRTGAELGFIFDISFGHFALQPALQFSQKGFTIKDTYSTTDNSTGTSPQITTSTRNEDYRFNYFTIPLNLAFTLGQKGQGLQLFAGPYLGVLIAGNFSYDNSSRITAGNTVISTTTTKRDGDVSYGDYYSGSNADQKFYSRSFDAGLQAGLGYRIKGFLLQTGYSWGLRNVGADYKYSGNGQTQIVPGPSYYNRAFQLSLSYLAGLKK